MGLVGSGSQTHQTACITVLIEISAEMSSEPNWAEMAAVQYGLQRERDELRAENERLEADNARLRQILARSDSDEMLELRAENERLNRQVAAFWIDIDAKDDEIERLRAELAQNLASSRKSETTT